MVERVDRWLETLGFKKYAVLFAENEITIEVLPELGEADLKELGLPLGPRKLLLKAIGELVAEPAEPTPHIDGVHTAMPVGTAERRQLTVMFVDLVGSTALSARLDLEEMGAVLRAYQNAVAGEIARFEGHVAKFMGDGVLAYFGWPVAHEDEAERAVRAGLAVRDAVANLATGAGEPLASRIGIATGLVVVGELIGEGAAQEQTVVGETPNLAARLQGVAEPGKVVIAEATRRLLGDIFSVADLGALTVKGIAEPVPAFAVTGERTAENRFEARRGPSLLPLIGREQELALLLERWRQAKAGEGQLVLLAGEAGIGKSRITRALVDTLAEEAHLRVTWQGSPYHTDSALHPAIQQLSMAAGFASGDSVEAQLDKLEATLGQTIDDSRAAAPLLAALLGLDGRGRYGLLDLTPAQQRARTLTALLGQLTGLANREPVLFVLEDAHWIDPTTLELVDLALDRIARTQVLLLVTARPTFTHGFGGHPIVTRLALNRLGREQTGAIMARITDGKALPGALVDEIAARTDGVPLYVEEMTKAVLESGVLRETDDAFVLDGPLSALAIPTTLHDSLMARLDRLQPLKQVAQTAAVIGRDFDYSTLAAISSLPTAELQEALARLVDAELVFQRGRPPDASYLFKHALVRDAAYQSLLKSRRQELHAALLAVLEQLPDTAPELVAQHAEAAGNRRLAFRYWRQAGEAALERPAYREAASFLNAALGLLDTIDDGQQRAEIEMELLVKLAQARVATHGFTSDALAEVSQRAMTVVDRLGDTPGTYPIWFFVWGAGHVAGESNAPAASARRMIQAAERIDDPDEMMVAIRHLAVSLVMGGRHEEATPHLERAMSLYVPARHEPMCVRFGQEPGVSLRAYLGISLWCRGFPDQAREAIAPAVPVSRRIRHTISLAHALCHTAWIASLRREPANVLEAADQLIAVSTEHGLPMWRTFGLGLSGIGHLQAGDAEAAVGRLAAGAEQAQASKSGLMQAYADAYRGLALASLGRHEAAAAALDAARDMVDAGRELWARSEVLRVVAEVQLLGPSNDRSAAETLLVEAIAAARTQKARSFEIRAARDLARLWAERGERQQALDLLAPVYDWFTEGFATPDLVEAKALLDELR